MQQITASSPGHVPGSEFLVRPYSLHVTRCRRDAYPVCDRVMHSRDLEEKQGAPCCASSSKYELKDGAASTQVAGAALQAHARLVSMTYSSRLHPQSQCLLISRCQSSKSEMGVKQQIRHPSVSALLLRILAQNGREVPHSFSVNMMLATPVSD